MCLCFVLLVAFVLTSVSLHLSSFDYAAVNRIQYADNKYVPDPAELTWVCGQAMTITYIPWRSQNVFRVHRVARDILTTT